MALRERTTNEKHMGTFMETNFGLPFRRWNDGQVSVDDNSFNDKKTGIDLLIFQLRVSLNRASRPRK